MPPARTVHRARLYLAAVSEYEAELQKEQQRQTEEAERNRNRGGSFRQGG